MRFSRPHFEFWMDAWILQIQTALWRTVWSQATKDYFIVDIRIFNKWGFRIRLFTTAEEICNAKQLKMKDASNGKINFFSRFKIK